MSSLSLPRYITRHVLFALVIGGMGGVVFMAFLIEFDHFSSSAEFCTTCHSMRYANETYQLSVHFKSDSGVRASCGHCHVSEGVFSATWDHIVGTKDLLKQIYGQIVGPDYDDPVVNLLHLPEAAFHAREWFRKTDSATCKRCHVIPAVLGKRPDTAEIHAVDAKGKTCIDCHYNLVHRKVPDEKTFKRDAWNAMVEQEFGLAPGTAAGMMLD